LAYCSPQIANPALLVSLERGRRAKTSGGIAATYMPLSDQTRSLMQVRSGSSGFMEPDANGISASSDQIGTAMSPPHRTSREPCL
jgi:hypothetical protein